MRITKYFNNKFNKTPNNIKRTGKNIAIAIAATGAVIYGGNNVSKDVNALKAHNQGKFELISNDTRTLDSSCISLNFKF